MKVRAYLTKDEDCLVPSKDSGRHIDFDTSTDDPDQIQHLCHLLSDIEYLDHFEEQGQLKAYLMDQDIIYRKYHWQGSGFYLLWQRIIYRSDILLERELQFYIALEEHLKRNSEGKIDRMLMEL